MDFNFKNVCFTRPIGSKFEVPTNVALVIVIPLYVPYKPICTNNEKTCIVGFLKIIKIEHCCRTVLCF